MGQNVTNAQDLDESSMIREQDRIAKEKKRKKNRRKKQITLILIAVLLVGSIWYLGWGRNMLAAQEDTEVRIVTAAGQQVIYAKLTNVKGNEITYTVAKALEEQESEGLSETGERPGRGGMPEGGMPDGGMSGGGMSAMPGEGGRGDMGAMPGEGGRGGMGAMSGEGGMPDMSAMFGEGGMPDMSSMFGGSFGQGTSVSRIAEDNFSYNDVTYVLTQEAVTAQIPVGTDVTTRLGTITTFSRLAAGDQVALVVEEDQGQQIIMAVYIIGS